MLNKVAVITGANAGLGYQTSVSLARMGARVVMACRNMEKAQQAQRELLVEVPDAQTALMQIDVSEPASIQQFGRQLAEQFGRIDLLINNAGILAIPLARNSAGYEMQLATNYLGTFALTGTLLPLFDTTEPARIVSVGSLAHRTGKLVLDDLNWEKSEYNEWQAYARSKVAMLSFMLELDRRLKRAGSNIISLGAHPGFAATDIQKNSISMQPKSAFSAWRKKKLARFIPTAAEAARPIVHAATAAGVQGGDYYAPSGLFEIAGKKVRQGRINPMSKDPALAKRLWALSESMTGVRFLSES